MKRLFLLFFLVFSTIIFGQTGFYVYENDKAVSGVVLSDSGLYGTGYYFSIKSDYSIPGPNLVPRTAFVKKYQNSYKVPEKILIYTRVPQSISGMISMTIAVQGSSGPDGALASQQVILYPTKQYVAQKLWIPSGGINYFDALKISFKFLEGESGVRNIYIDQIILVSGADSVLLDGCNFTTGVSDKKNNDVKFYLYQNYPNPFNPITKIEYFIPKDLFVDLKIFNILGSEVATLVNEEKPAGRYEVIFNGENFPSGLYICELKSKNIIFTRKMILLR